MNITAEIKVIKAMLEDVKDPSILTAIKELLVKATTKKYTTPTDVPMEVQEEVVSRYENLKAKPNDGISEEDMDDYLTAE